MKNTTKKRTAKEIYGVNAKATSTSAIKTDKGNYVYAHILSGNSVQETRVYNPTTKEDKLADNAGLFHYLHATLRLHTRNRSGLLFGEEVENSYNN